MSQIIEKAIARAKQISNGDAYAKIIKARAKLMKGHVGMASILLAVEFVEDNERCKTMATDGKRIYYNSEFVLSISEDELMGVILHEGAHIIFQHMLRRGTRDHKIWNYATDYVINIWLRHHGYVLPEGGLIDAKYRDMSAELVYRELTSSDESLQNAVDQINEGNDQQDGDQDSGQGSGSGDSDESDDSGQDGSGLSGDDTSEDSGSGSGSGESGKGSQTSKYSNLPDPVLGGEVWDAQDEDGNVLDQQQMAELSNEIIKRVSMAEKMEKAMGSGSTGGFSEVQEVTSADVDWLEIFRDHLEDTKSSDTTWNRLNRRHQWRGINLPSYDKDPQGGCLAVAIDTSGSVSQSELNVFATEIQNIAVECGLDRIMVCYCDTMVHKNSDGEWWDIYELDHEELDLKIRGGGGTCFDPPFNLFNKHTDDIDDVCAFAYFTDGWGNASEDVEPDVPVFWMLTEQSSYSDSFPFGEQIYVDPSSLR
tara:strand:+ start:3665 stop:5104 length:1440 start_codon:yes stop_codon:yes gene_type:complete